MIPVQRSIRPLYPYVLVPCLIALLSGCATLSKNECLNADWRLIGYGDGVSAQSRDRIGDHRKACAKHDVIPNKSAYDLGYQEGVIDFCSESRGYADGHRGNRVNSFCPTDTEYHFGYSDGVTAYCSYDRGYSEGRAGHGYKEVCPADLAPLFLEGYEAGLEIHALEAEIRGLEKRHYALVRRQESNVDEMEELRRRIAYEAELSGDERAALLDEIEDLGSDNVSIEREIVEIETALHDVEHALTELIGSEY